jgi:hypothetical protein
MDRVLLTGERWRHAGGAVAIQMFPVAAPLAGNLLTPDKKRKRSLLSGTTPLKQDRLRTASTLIDLRSVWLPIPRRSAFPRPPACSAGPVPLAIFVCCAMVLAPTRAADLVDHHQHLISPQALSVFSPSRAITAADLICTFGCRGPQSRGGSFRRVRPRPRQNDWVSIQVPEYSRRLAGFCAVNPRRNYAIREIGRCSKDGNLRTGLRMHFGNSDVNLDIEEHVERTRGLAAANAHGMVIVFHFRANIDRNRPYGANQARVLLERLLPAAPDIEKFIQGRISRRRD